MRLTLMIAGALVPAEVAAEFSSGLSAGALTRRLTRAKVESSSVGQSGTADEVWLSGELFAGMLPIPTAPYARAELGGDPAVSDQVWHADPVHLAIGLDSAVVQSLDATPPDVSESDVLIGAAREHLEPAGCHLERLGDRWFLRTVRKWTFNTPSLAASIGLPVALTARDDEDALAWSRLHNAVQMSWHDHPANVAREERGLPTISGLWLHGGGNHRPLPALRWSQVLSDRPELRGAARAAGAAAAPLGERVIDPALIVWDDALKPSRTHDWSDWREAMLQIEQRYAALPVSSVTELVLTGRRSIKRWRIRNSDRLRWWRARTLAEACAE